MDGCHVNDYYQYALICKLTKQTCKRERVGNDVFEVKWMETAMPNANGRWLVVVVWRGLLAFVVKVEKVWVFGGIGVGGCM